MSDIYRMQESKIKYKEVNMKIPCSECEYCDDCEPNEELECPTGKYYVLDRDPKEEELIKNFLEKYRKELDDKCRN